MHSEAHWGVEKRKEGIRVSTGDLASYLFYYNMIYLTVPGLIAALRPFSSMVTSCRDMNS